MNTSAITSCQTFPDHMGEALRAGIWGAIDSSHFARCVSCSNIQPRSTEVPCAD